MNFSRPILPLPLPPGPPDPNAGFPRDRLDRAAAIVDSALTFPRPDQPDGVPDAALLSARVHVRRIVAALCGATTLAEENVQRYDALAVVPRPLLERLQQAACDPRVTAALAEALGTAEAGALIDDLASIT